MRTPICVAALAAAVLLGGCVGGGRCCPREARAEPAMPQATPRPAPEPADPGPRRKALYRGDDGKPADWCATLAAWKDADIVAFGEFHGHPIGAAAELALLKAMHAQGRPLALAMEFLERDTQPTVDAYLAGTIPDEEFKRKARQSRAYDKTHGPLMAYCREHKIPVIAANAPRRLVRAYRKQDEDYEGFLAGLSEEDRGWLPEETSILEDAYRDRFMKLMGSKRGPSFFRSQSLWDDAMAEAMYDFRRENPNHRILFIVGAFHVESGLGTISKYKLRRGKDDIRLIVMDMEKDPALPFREEDVGKADLLIKVPTPTKRAKPTGPNPHAAPPKQ